MEEYNENVKQMIGNDEEVATVYRTADYSKFKKLEGNRGVEDDRISKIKSSINKVGYVISPIIVNEKFEVIDGQGRLATFKEMGIPVDYVIAMGKGIDECIAMNINQTNWNLLDYVQSYADRGDRYYQKLLDLLGRYSTMGMDEITCALMGWQRTDSLTVKDGALKFTDEKYMEAIVKLNAAELLYNDLSERELLDNLKSVGSIRTLLRVFMICMDLHDIDMARLHRCILNGITGPRATTYKDEISCAKTLEDLYNYKATNRVYISSLYRERLKVIKAEKSRQQRQARGEDGQFIKSNNNGVINETILSQIDRSLIVYLNDKKHVNEIYNRQIRAIELHNGYFNYCLRNGLKPITNTQFYKQLELIGFEKRYAATYGGGDRLFYYKEYSAD